MSEQSYLDLLQDIMENGINSDDRTGVGTRSVFGRMLRFDLLEGFPLLTTKKVSFHNVATELLWFIRGGDDGGNLNIKHLKSRGVNIWNEWADAEGNIGVMYGSLWRDADGGADPLAELIADPLAELIAGIKNDPSSRRHCLTSWVYHYLDKGALAPCHGSFIQFYVRDGYLSCHMTQRSADSFLGLPYNIASYALLTHIIAHLTGYTVRDLVISLGDAHIYSNHFDQVEKQLRRKPKGFPVLRFGAKAKAASCIEDFVLGGVESFDFNLYGYDPHPAIKAPVAV